MALAKTFDHKYRFRVLIPGFALSAGQAGPSLGGGVTALFQTCSEIAAEVATVEHQEGGSIYNFKEPGRVTFPDVTLERGFAGGAKGEALHAWFAATVASTAAGLFDGSIFPLNDGFQLDVTILQYNRGLIPTLDDSVINPNALLEKIILHNAWVKRYSAGDWDNAADEVRIEQVVLAYEFFTRERVG